MWQGRLTIRRDDEAEGVNDNEKARCGVRSWTGNLDREDSCEGSCYREQGEHRLGAALWSPQKAKNGADIYKDMRQCEKGTLYSHLIDNKQFSGVSVAAGTADSTFQGLPNTRMARSGLSSPVARLHAAGSAT